jgi:hypothetical protein
MGMTTLHRVIVALLRQSERRQGRVEQQEQQRRRLACASDSPVDVDLEPLAAVIVRQRGLVRLVPVLARPHTSARTIYLATGDSPLVKPATSPK